MSYEGSWISSAPTENRSDPMTLLDEAEAALSRYGQTPNLSESVMNQIGQALLGNSDFVKKLLSPLNNKIQIIEDNTKQIDQLSIVTERVGNVANICDNIASLESTVSDQCEFMKSLAADMSRVDKLEEVIHTPSPEITSRFQSLENTLNTLEKSFIGEFQKINHQEAESNMRIKNLEQSNSQYCHRLESLGESLQTDNSNEMEVLQNHIKEVNERLKQLENMNNDDSTDRICYLETTFSDHKKRLNQIEADTSARITSLKEAHSETVRILENSLSSNSKFTEQSKSRLTASAARVNDLEKSIQQLQIEISREHKSPAKQTPRSKKIASPGTEPIEKSKLSVLEKAIRGYGERIQSLENDIPGSATELEERLTLLEGAISINKNDMYATVAHLQQAVSEAEESLHNLNKRTQTGKCTSSAIQKLTLSVHEAAASGELLDHQLSAISPSTVFSDVSETVKSISKSIHVLSTKFEPRIATLETSQSKSNSNIRKLLEKIPNQESNLNNQETIKTLKRQVRSLERSVQLQAEPVSVLQSQLDNVTAALERHSLFETDCGGPNLHVLTEDIAVIKKQISANPAAVQKQVIQIQNDIVNMQKDISLLSENGVSGVDNSIQKQLMSLKADVAQIKQSSPETVKQQQQGFPDQNLLIRINNLQREVDSIVGYNCVQKIDDLQESSSKLRQVFESEVFQFRRPLERELNNLASQVIETQRSVAAMKTESQNYNTLRTDINNLQRVTEGVQQTARKQISDHHSLESVKIELSEIRQKSLAEPLSRIEASCAVNTGVVRAVEETANECKQEIEVLKRIIKSNDNSQSDHRLKDMFDSQKREYDVLSSKFNSLEHNLEINYTNRLHKAVHHLDKKITSCVNQHSDLKAETTKVISTKLSNADAYIRGLEQKVKMNSSDEFLQGSVGEKIIDMGASIHATMTKNDTSETRLTACEGQLSEVVSGVSILHCDLKWIKKRCESAEQQNCSENVSILTAMVTALDSQVQKLSSAISETASHFSSYASQDYVAKALIPFKTKVNNVTEEVAALVGKNCAPLQEAFNRNQTELTAKMQTIDNCLVEISNDMTTVKQSQRTLIDANNTSDGRLCNLEQFSASQARTADTSLSAVQDNLDRSTEELRSEINGRIMSVIQEQKIFKNDISTLASQLNQLESSTSRLPDVICSRMSSFERLGDDTRHEVALIRSKIDSLEGLFNGFSQDSRETVRNLSDFTKLDIAPKLQSVEALLSEIKPKITSVQQLHQHYDDMKVSLDDISQREGTLNKQIAHRLSSVENSNQETHTFMERTIQQIASVRDDVLRSESSFQEMSQKVILVENQNQEVRDVIIASGDDVGRLSQEVGNLKQQITNRLTSIEILTQQHDDSLTDVSQRDSHLTSLREDIDYLKQQTSNRLTSVENMTQQHDNSLTAVYKQREEMTTRLMNFERLHEDIKHLKQQTSHRLTSIENITQEHDISLTKQREEMTTRLGNVERLSEDIKHLKQQITNRLTSIEILTQQHDDSLTDVSQRDVVDLTDDDNQINKRLLTIENTTNELTATTEQIVKQLDNVETQHNSTSVEQSMTSLVNDVDALKHESDDNINRMTDELNSMKELIINNPINEIRDSLTAVQQQQRDLSSDVSQRLISTEIATKSLMDKLSTVEDVNISTSDVNTDQVDVKLLDIKRQCQREFSSSLETEILRTEVGRLTEMMDSSQKGNSALQSSLQLLSCEINSVKSELSVTSQQVQFNNNNPEVSTIRARISVLESKLPETDWSEVENRIKESEKRLQTLRAPNITSSRRVALELESVSNEIKISLGDHTERLDNIEAAIQLTAVLVSPQRCERSANPQAISHLSKRLSSLEQNYKDMTDVITTIEQTTTGQEYGQSPPNTTIVEESMLSDLQNRMTLLEKREPYLQEGDLIDDLKQRIETIENKQPADDQHTTLTERITPQEGDQIDNLRQRIATIENKQQLADNQHTTLTERITPQEGDQIDNLRQRIATIENKQQLADNQHTTLTERITPQEGDQIDNLRQRIATIENKQQLADNQHTTLTERITPQEGDQIDNLRQRIATIENKQQLADNQHTTLTERITPQEGDQIDNLRQRIATIENKQQLADNQHTTLTERITPQEGDQIDNLRQRIAIVENSKNDETIENLHQRIHLIEKKQPENQHNTITTLTERMIAIEKKFIEASDDQSNEIKNLQQRLEDPNGGLSNKIKHQIESGLTTIHTTLTEMFDLQLSDYSNTAIAAAKRAELQVSNLDDLTKEVQETLTQLPDANQIIQLSNMLESQPWLLGEQKQHDLQQSLSAVTSEQSGQLRSLQTLVSDSEHIVSDLSERLFSLEKSHFGNSRESFEEMTNRMTNIEEKFRNNFLPKSSLESLSSKVDQLESTLSVISRKTSSNKIETLEQMLSDSYKSLTSRISSLENAVVVADAPLVSKIEDLAMAASGLKKEANAHGNVSEFASNLSSVENAVLALQENSISADVVYEKIEMMTREVNIIKNDVNSSKQLFSKISDLESTNTALDQLLLETVSNLERTSTQLATVTLSQQHFDSSLLSVTNSQADYKLTIDSLNKNMYKLTTTLHDTVSEIISVHPSVKSLSDVSFFFFFFCTHEAHKRNKKCEEKKKVKLDREKKKNQKKNSYLT